MKTFEVIVKATLEQPVNPNPPTGGSIILPSPKPEIDEKGVTLKEALLQISPHKLKMVG